MKELMYLSQQQQQQQQQQQERPSCRAYGSGRLSTRSPRQPDFCHSPGGCDRNRVAEGSE